MSANYVYRNVRTRFGHTAAAYVVSYIVSYVISYVVSAVHSMGNERGTSALAPAQQNYFQVIENGSRPESLTREAGLLTGRNR